MKIARDLSTDLRIRTLIDEITAPAVVIGADLCVQHMNAPFRALTRDMHAPAGQQTLCALLAPADWALVQAAIATNADAQTVVLADGRQQLTLSPVNGPSNDRIGYLGIVAQASALQNHEMRRWQAILANIEEGIWDYDAITDSRFRSDGWRRIRGLAADDTSRNTRDGWRAHVHPDHLDELDALHAGILAGRIKEFDITYRERHAKGHWLWITSAGKVTQSNAQGLPLHVVASNRDVTQTKTEQERLASLETLKERWKVSVESADQGLWDHNLQTGERYCSDIWHRLRGFEPQERIGDTQEDWLAYVHPDDQCRLRKDIAAIDRGDTDQIRHEYRERHKDGHYIWILSRGRVVSRDENGAPVHIIGNDTDITAIKTSSETLKNLSKSLELAVTTAGIGVWEYNVDTGVAKWDAMMHEIYGLKSDGTAPIGNAWERLLHPDDHAAATEEANRCLASGDEFSQDYRILRPDKTVRYVRSRAAQFVDESGARRVIGVNWDVTEDRNRADVLRQANALAQKQNIALEAARAKMEHSALHDALTGLANRRKLDEVEKTVHGQATALHIDLDRFKQINDTLGHAAGDQVIMHAANILRAAAPPNALVARVGGDEFVILLPETPDRESLEKLADNIIATAAQPVKVNGKDCRFGMSVGIATGENGESGSSLFANADIALYLAKNEGRGRYRFFSNDLRTAMQAKNKLSDEILTALQNDEFFCLYQPQFDARTLDLSGVEALVRWRHPDGKIRGPDAFLPVAEELNVVGQIDQIVLDKAIADTQHWRDAGLPVPRMSVNVSARRLIDPMLPSKMACLKDAPGEFAFELLESVFLDTHDDQLAANLAAIRDGGVDIEVDDFGTGHASIVGLLKLNPNRLKIDRQLVGPVDTSAKQRLLVKSIVEIGKLQGIGVVAEGVETAAHIDVLRDLGCDHLQGYGLARPMPRDQLTALLDAAHSNGKYSPYHKRPHQD